MALAEAGSPGPNVQSLKRDIDKEVQAGDRILFGKYSGNEVRIEDNKYLTTY